MSFSPKYDDYSKDVVVDTYASDKVYGGDAGTQVAGQQYAPSTSPDADIMTGHHLKKSLRWWDLLGLGIGCIIGAGIFVTTGRVFTNVTGPAIVISYVVAGTCCAFASLCYSEFAAMAPSSGSAYAFTSQTLGEIPAMMVGWNLALEYAVSSATVTQGFSAYFQTFVGLCGGNIFPRNADPNSPSYMNTGASGSGNQWISYTFWDYAQGSGPFLTGSAVDLWAMLLAICLGCLVTWGVNESARFNNIMVVIKVTIVLFVISLGAYYSTAGFTPFAPYGFGGLQFFGNKAFGQSNADGAPIGMLAGASTVFFAYIGFDAVTAQSEEAKNPGRDLPIGIIGSLVISTCLYIAVCLVLSAMIPYEWYMPGSTGLADRGISRGSILADIFTFYGQRWAAFIVCIGAIAGLTSVTLVTMMGQPRIFMAMARDGLLPKFFCEIHPKTQTPYKACILFTVFITTLAGILPGNVLLDMTNIGTLFAFTFVCISLPIYRYMNPDRPRPFRAPLSSWKFPLVPVLGAGLSIILAFSLDSQNWYRLLGWMGAGALLYILWGRRNARKVREMKAALPAAQQFHQGPDLEYNNQHGITTDSLSDPSEGVHKDNIGDSAYIPHHHQHHDAAAPSYGQPQNPSYNNNAVYV